MCKDPTVINFVGSCPKCTSHLQSSLIVPSTLHAGKTEKYNSLAILKIKHLEGSDKFHAKNL